MNRSQRFFSFGVLFLLLAVTFSPAVQAVTNLTDIEGNKNQTEIEWLYNNKVISGYPDKTFRPTGYINRAELVKILVQLNDWTLPPERYKDCFPDVRQEWFAVYVCFAKEQGWVKGYTDGTFRPEQKVLKVEAIKMLVNARRYSVPQIFSGAPKLFDDVQSDTWYYPFLYTAQEKELLEQTSGNYGVNNFITRGEISGNLYRAMIIDQNGLNKFSEYAALTRTTQTADCSQPVQAFGDIEIAKGEMKILTVPVCKSYRYTACTQDVTGNPDLYGASYEPTPHKFEQKSTENIMTVSDPEGGSLDLPRPDCITFEPQGPMYYVGVFGSSELSRTNIWLTGSKLDYVPKGFEKSLVWFADSCTGLTTSEYGPFNTPWGNAGDLDRPFFDGYPHYLHGGTDYACPSNTEVKAMCDGFIADSDDAGGDWGWHTVLECHNNGQALALSFIHLQKESVLPIGTKVQAGDVIGKVFALKAAGEMEHVHITACNASHDDCEAAGFHPERGASRRTEWWGVSQYWFDMDWHTNPGLYKVLPKSVFIPD